MLSDGSRAIIEDVKVEKFDTPETTYNFEVEGYHTYYVTEQSILVHNMCQTNDADKMLQFESRAKLQAHYDAHGGEFEGLFNGPEEYLRGANYVINNGTYVPEMNGYLRFFGAKGGANYAFVGLSQDGSYITTFGIRGVGQLTKVPWLIP